MRQFSGGNWSTAENWDAARVADAAPAFVVDSNVDVGSPDAGVTDGGTEALSDIALTQPIYFF